MEPSFDDVKVDNMLTTSVPIKSVKVHANLQPRVEMNDDHVKQIVNALVDNNNVLDDKPIHCWNIKNDIANSLNGLYVVDGHHRFKAFRDKSLKFQTVDVIIHESERPENMNDFEFEAIQMSDALKFAIQANNHNGSPLKRSQADNRRAITLILDDRTNVKMSDSAIAELCGVSAPTVAKVRKTKLAYQSESRVTSDGRTISHSRQSSGVLARVPLVVSYEPEVPLKTEHASPVEVAPIAKSKESDHAVILRPEPDLIQLKMDLRYYKSHFDNVWNLALERRPDLFSKEEDNEDRPEPLDILNRVLDSIPVQVARFEPITGTSSDRVANKRHRFDWSNLDSVRESMAISQGVKNSRFTKWYNDFRVGSKRTKFPNLPDDEVLKSMWSDLNRSEPTGSTLEQSA